ncbi:MAG: hypothetical protein Q7S62_01455 [bacterium]|nr:hypothetical protein [bacterium]
MEEALPELPLIGETPEKLMAIINTVTDWIFAGFVVAAVIMVILAALQFVREGGNPEKMSEARMKLIWAAVGIGIALMAEGFVPVVRNILGAD